MSVRIFTYAFWIRIEGAGQGMNGSLIAGFYSNCVAYVLNLYPRSAIRNVDALVFFKIIYRIKHSSW